jgi:hypothetical protein
MPRACQLSATETANSRLWIVLVDDVSRLADYGLAPVVKHFCQQGEMPAVVDVGEALQQRLWQLVEPVHEAGIATLRREARKNSLCSSAS